MDHHLLPHYNTTIAAKVSPQVQIGITSRLVGIDGEYLIPITGFDNANGY
jgi:hypothetical protein